MKRNMYENKCIENSSLFTSLCSVEVQQSGRNGTCFCIFNEILIPFSLRSDGVKEMTECMVKRHLAFRNYDIGPKGVYKIHIVQFENMLAPSLALGLSIILSIVCVVWQSCTFLCHMEILMHRFHPFAKIPYLMYTIHKSWSSE